MKTFLEIVADDILKKYGSDLRRVAVVFPNKRAALFLKDALVQRVQRPMWAPAAITISELFRRQSPLAVADPIRLVCELHRVYARVTETSETLDHFYGWGQLIISDFDDLDKNMADAHDVFRNLSNHHNFDDVSYLSDEQVAQLQHFFRNFTADHNSRLKERFMRLWSRFEDIYNEFRHCLRAKGLAYEGMLYRDVAEGELSDLPYDVYLFVGFNMMQQAEQRLCSRLMKDGRAKFYWDFDQYYMAPRHEAGHYIRELLEQSPNELDSTEESIYRCFAAPKDITFVSAPTEHVQARYAAQWLRENHRIADGRRTVIVMADEHLLPTVIHCLPEEVEKVNVTTGYPLADMPVSSFVQQLSQLRLSDKTPRYLVRRVQRHPLAATLDKEMLSRPIANDADYLRWIQAVVRHVATHSPEAEDMQRESFFRMYTLLNRLAALVEDGHLTATRPTLQRLLLQIVRTTTIPFHGEPAVGLQVMGVLETRNLDFSHVLLLSCNEGNLPRGINDVSFIPYVIRRAFGLTTVDNKVAIFAYYFYRLLQRADDITICYNNATREGQTGEMSRFMLQLMVEGGHPIARQALMAGNETITTAAQARDKDARALAFLNNFERVSPSAINRYMRCPLSFYFYYVMNIKEPDDNDDNEIDNRLFGDIFHRAAQLIYDPLVGRTITHPDIDDIIQHRDRTERAVDQAIAELLFDNAQNRDIHDLNGLQLINREVIINYLERLFQIDSRLTPFTILGNETKLYRHISFPTAQGTRTVEVGGSIDRLDRVCDADTGSPHLRVVDYKTGSKVPSKKTCSVEEIFHPVSLTKQHTDYFLQTMLYASIVRNNADVNPQGLPVAPALLFIQHTKGDDYDPILKLDGKRITDIDDYIADYDDHLRETLTEIFNPDIPFKPTTHDDVCGFCPYRQLCNL